VRCDEGAAASNARVLRFLTAPGFLPRGCAARSAARVAQAMPKSVAPPAPPARPVAAAARDPTASPDLLAALPDAGAEGAPAMTTTPPLRTTRPGPLPPGHVSVRLTVGGVDDRFAAQACVIVAPQWARAATGALALRVSVPGHGAHRQFALPLIRPTAPVVVTTEGPPQALVVFELIPSYPPGQTAVARGVLSLARTAAPAVLQWLLASAC